MSYLVLFCYLFLCFSVLLALRLPRLRNRELLLVLFVRFFDLRLFGFVCFLFLFLSGRGCGLWLWALPGLFLLPFFYTLNRQFNHIWALQPSCSIVQNYWTKFYLTEDPMWNLVKIDQWFHRRHLKIYTILYRNKAFVVYSTRRYVLCLASCYFALFFFFFFFFFFSPFSIAITSLGEERTSYGVSLCACLICAGLVLSVSCSSW